MIKRIYVKNFKCFEEVSVECRELNLFTGVNGMGKSTIIQALLLLRQTSEQLVPGRENIAILNGKYVSLGTLKDISYWYKKDDEICVCAEENNDIFACRYDSGKKALVFSNRILRLEPDNLSGDGFEYICAERLGPRRYYDDLDRETYSSAQVGAKGEYTISSLYSLGSDLQVYENMRNDKENSRTLELQVNAWMSEISPGIKVKTVPYLDVNMMGLRYAKQSMMGEESTNAVNMGFGVSYVLPVVVALLKARKGDLLIIENPEAHLHPKGQRQIGELAAKAAANGVQIIMETHSDHVLNGVRLSVKQQKIQPEQVGIHYFGVYEEDGIWKHEKTSPEILEDGSLSNWPEGFFDEWDKAIDLLF